MTCIKYIITLVSIVALVAGCARMSRHTLSKDEVVVDHKVILSNSDLKVEIGDVDVEGVSMGAWWLLHVYTASVKATNILMRESQAEEVIHDELIKSGIQVVESSYGGGTVDDPTTVSKGSDNAVTKENSYKGGKPSYIIDFDFNSLVDSDYHFMASISIKEYESENYVFQKDYKAYPDFMVDDTDQMLEASFRNAVIQFVHDKEALFAMNSYSGAMHASVPNASKNSLTSLDEIIMSSKRQPSDVRKYSLIIGIDDYVQQSNVKFALNSAKSFEKLSTHVLGVPEENVIKLYDRSATSGQIKARVALIKELLEPNDTLYFYYAGHGVPGIDGNIYLLPSDMRASEIHLEPNLRINKIYETLNNSQAKHIYAFVDSCYSGKDDKGELLYRGVAPVLKRKEKIFSSSKLTIMTAGSSTEFANQYTEEEQRLFSYYLIRGMSELDRTNDINELYSYVRRKVKRESLRIGLAHKQVPSLITH